MFTKAKTITAVYLSAEVLAKAKEKITSEHVQFIQADILQDWNFTNTKYDLVSFSPVLEHIENLETLFDKVSNSVVPGGYV